MKQTIGQKIKELRTKKNLTQEQLADKLCVTAQAVSKWERDESYPDIILLKPLAKELDTKIGQLLGEEPETKMVDPSKLDPNRMLLRIVVDTEEGEKIKVNLPVIVIMSVAENEQLLNLITQGNGEKLKGIDFKQILQMISLGVMGKLVEVESKEANVSIWVE